MTTFYLLNLIIGFYFALTTVALFSDKAANICLKFYDATEYSLNNHRNVWIATIVILMVLYCNMWFRV